MYSNNADPFFTKESLSKGIGVLNKLWKKDVTPKRLWPHYILTWYLLHSGNLRKASKNIGRTRNQNILILNGVLGAKKIYPLRRKYLAFKNEHPTQSFETNFNEIWESSGLKPTLSFGQNRGLISLWITGFPLENITAAFYLWAIRSGKDRKWIMDKLNQTSRYSFYYFRKNCLKRFVELETWLEPLRPMMDDFYYPFPSGRPKK